MWAIVIFMITYIGVAMGRIPGLFAVVILVLLFFTSLPREFAALAVAGFLLIRFLDPTQPQQWYLLALASTFAGNLITIGSIANLIVIEQARKYGIHISFEVHLKTGLLVSGWSLLVLLGWIHFAG